MTTRYPPAQTAEPPANDSSGRVWQRQHQRGIRKCRRMTPDGHRGKYEASGKGDGTDGRSSHGVHARKGTAHAGPREDEGKYDRERDNLIEMEVERKEGRRSGSRDVNEPPGSLGRQATPTRKLGHRKEPDEGNGRSQKGQNPHVLRSVRDYWFQDAAASSVSTGLATFA